MKNHVRVWTTTGLLLGLMASSAMALEVGVYEPLPQAEIPVETATQQIVDPVVLEEAPTSNVPQAQIDLRDKRLEMRQRRDRMLKVRQQTIQDLNQQQAQ